MKTSTKKSLFARLAESAVKAIASRTILMYFFPWPQMGLAMIILVLLIIGLGIDAYISANCADVPDSTRGLQLLP